MSKERRKHFRNPVSQVSKTTVSAGQGQEADADVINLSESGLLLRSPINIETNQELLLSFTLEHHQSHFPIKCRGIVRWSAPEGDHHLVGLLFTRISEEHLANVRAYMKEQQIS